MREKKNPVLLEKVRFEVLHEGVAAQILHVGPFADEGLTIQKIHDYIHESGHIFDGLQQKHHEIYLSDMRKIDPKKLRTIIRQPFV